MVVRLTRRVVAACLAALPLLAATGAEAAAARTDPGGPWLSRLNQLRAFAGVDPVVENAGQSSDASDAAEWLAENRQFTHDIDDPSAPESARRGAARSNLFAGASGVAAIDGWINSLGHGAPMLHAALTEAGYGTHTASGPHTVTALTAVVGEGGEDPSSPYVFPQDGVTDFDLLSGSSDHIRQLCGWPTGSPDAHGPTLRVMGAGSPFREVEPVRAADAFLEVEGAAVEVCVLDPSDEATLESADALAIIPRRPLPYRATVTLETSHRGRPVSVGFTTAAPSPGRLVELDPECPHRESGFPDVPPSDPSSRAIRCLRDAGVVTGRADGSFGLAAGLTRGQMASIIERLLVVGGAPPLGSVADAFVDDTGSAHEPTLNRLAARGIYHGRGGGIADPNGPVTRGELASFLDRARDVLGLPVQGVPPDAASDDDGNVHEPAIDRMVWIGVAHLFGSGFAPNAAISRAESAQFLARLFVFDRAMGR